MTKTLTLLALISSFGCGSSEPAARTPATETTTDTVATGDEAPSEVTEESDDATADSVEAEGAASSTLIVTRISGSESAPATAYEGASTSVQVRPEDGALRVNLANFVFYCEPAPTFAARIEGDVLVLQAEAPDGPVTRCIGPHSSQLKIEGVPPGEYTVSVRNTDGREVATGTASNG